MTDTVVGAGPSTLGKRVSADRDADAPREESAAGTVPATTELIAAEPTIKRSRIIRVTASEKGSIAPEWGIVELQGELDPGPDEIGGEDLGVVTMEHGRPVMVIGAHRLEGRVAKVAKPIAVLHKKAVPTPVSAEAAAKGGNAALVASTEYEIVGIVSKKYLFKTRPRPVVHAGDVQK